MSDGNYNRNLLPYHNYQSGVRAGRASMKALAVEAFAQWLDETSIPGLTEEIRRNAIADFKSRLP